MLLLVYANIAYRLVIIFTYFQTQNVIWHNAKQSNFQLCPSRASRNSVEYCKHTLICLIATIEFPHIWPMLFCLQMFRLRIHTLFTLANSHKVSLDAHPPTAIILGRPRLKHFAQCVFVCMWCVRDDIYDSNRCVAIYLFNSNRITCVECVLRVREPRNRLWYRHIANREHLYSTYKKTLFFCLSGT